ncbi:MAG: hypothetical protein J1F71_00245 [Clostridiales bacterium]|nr:hypothetical protein [Clostridiales bacterium]
MLHAEKRPAQAYGVYYNEEYTSPELPYKNCYGYSLRFQCLPILDIATGEFINNEAHFIEFTTLLTKYINNCFVDKRQCSTLNISKITKWQKAILMFNSAYENASIEKYDNALVALLVILESLFISNSRNKKERVVLALMDFIQQDTLFSESYIRQLVTSAYKLRNQFVHEGIGMDNDAYWKSINDCQGLAMGMKPFAH